MIKLLIFDWDDTLTTGSIEGYYKCYAAALISVGVRIGYAQVVAGVQAYWGRPHQVVMSNLLPDHPGLVEAACQVYRQAVRSELFTDGITMVPGANEVLESLATRYTIALATSCNPDTLHTVMRQCGTPRVWSEILTLPELDDPINQGKPSGYMAEKIMSTLRFSPEETLIIGDAPGDVGMAKSSGARVVIVQTGVLTEREARALAADFILPTVADLPQVLESLQA